jgi:hypothetical protein
MYRLVETSHEGAINKLQTDRTIPNNKPAIVIRDNDKATSMLIDVAISGDRNVIRKEAEKILKYEDLTKEITAHVECKNKNDAGSNRGNWNHLE